MPADQEGRPSKLTPFKDAIIELSDEDAGGHGDHWSMFADNPSQLIGQILPQAVREAQSAMCYADTSGARPMPLPSEEPAGTVLSWPMQRFGVFLIVQLSEGHKGGELASAFPRASDGVEHVVDLEVVRLWPNRLEAQIEGVVGNGAMPIVFFDPLFARHRGFYQKDGRYRFIFTGFPYRIEVCDSPPIVINDPERVRAMRRATEPQVSTEETDSEPIVIQTKGMAALFPLQDAGADDYQFQGPVKSVTELDAKMLGCRTWRVRVTVARFSELSDEDFDIDLYVTEKALESGALPKIGDDVRGILWLQGYLWMPESDQAT
jgi:hypothetical protein